MICTRFGSTPVDSVNTSSACSTVTFAGGMVMRVPPSKSMPSAKPRKAIAAMHTSRTTAVMPYQVRRLPMTSMPPEPV